MSASKCPSVEQSQAVVAKVKVGQRLMEFNERVIDYLVDGVVRNIESFQTYESARSESCQSIERQIQRHTASICEVRRTLATLRRAEFGFFGVVV